MMVESLHMSIASFMELAGRLGYASHEMQVQYPKPLNPKLAGRLGYASHEMQVQYLKP